MVSIGYLASKSERRRNPAGERPCGTEAGAQRHRQRDDPLCEACAEASRRWGRLYRAQKKLDRRCAAGASASELFKLGEELIRLELEYRSLEQLTDAPQPPNHSFLVYRYTFENGESYVGMTERSLKARHAEHVSGNARQTGGSAKVYALVADGFKPELTVIESGLTEGQARELERAEIAKLAIPLNIQGPVKHAPIDDWLDEVATLPPTGIDDETAQTAITAVRDEFESGE